ncbi:MAG: hypothetical protein HOP19_21595 [Acidobacteria bacterium]|nr:hypothetical protein [Acidobacteriota bacterium]
MLNKFFSVSCLLLLCAVFALAQAPQETEMPKFDLGEYQFGILRRGAKWEPTTDANKDALTKLQAGHMANIQKMASVGKLVAAGPMAGDGEIRGIFICNAGSVAAAQALAVDDPMIQAGRLKLDWYVWQAPKGIGEKMLAEYKTNPAMKMTMAKYYLTLLIADPKADLNAAQKLLPPHLWDIRRNLDKKIYVAAGPIGNDKELRGLFIINADSPEAAQEIAQRDPMVKAGLLKAEIHTWWVAKEVWQ